MNVTINDTPNTVVVTQEDVSVTVTESNTDVTVSDIGVQGAQGPTGPSGLTPIFTRQNQIAVSTGLTRFYFDTSRTISKIRASVGTPSTGSDIVVAVLINGTSIGNVRIFQTEYTGTLTLSKSVVANDYATVNITSVGSTYPGSDLTVVLTID